ncbi:MAG: hypothetical protein ACI8X5_003792 [Planctomycetota bacterium]|jgi:hypothetical protein
MKTSRKCLLALTPLFLVGASSGQALNIDVGPNLVLWPAPSSFYLGAAGQEGIWNELKDPLAGDTLVDLQGVPTSVTLTSNITSSFSYPFGTFGLDDDAFTSDGQSISYFGPAAVWTFSGLNDGQYELYTYCWDPSNSGTQTDVSIVGPLPVLQTVGGVWNGGTHVLGVTYAQHSVNVSGGILEVQAYGNMVGDSGTVLGFQLVTGSIFTSYCFGDGSSGICPCANIGGVGEGCRNSTGGGATLSASGSDSVTTDNLLMTVSGGPPTTAALLFVGDQEVNAGLGFAFGDGLRCAGGQVTRMGVETLSVGSGTWGPNLSAAGGWSAGDTRYFQTWYRDVNNSPCGLEFNLSQGARIIFTP